MTTPLTLYGYQSTSATLPYGGAMTTNANSGATALVASSLGTNLGYGEVTAVGTTNAWGALTSLQDPTGNGFVYDSTVLEGQQVVAGTWQFSYSLQLSGVAGTIVADLYTRVYLFNSTGYSYVLVGTASLLGQTISSASPTNYSLVMTLPAFPSEQFASGDKLYVDIWANVTTNLLGGSGLNIGIVLPTSSLNGQNVCQVITPGYQPTSQSMLSQAYSFGSFQFHDFSNYIVTSKNLETVRVNQTYFKIARFDGVKKNGEAINERQIQINVFVLASSRNELEQKLDALAQGMSLRQQKLTLHSLDSRYWIADCVEIKAPLPKGRIVGTEAQLTFIAQNPYALSQVQRVFNDNSFTYAFVSGGTWQHANIPFTGYGTADAFPTITLTNNMVSNSNTLSTTITNGTSGITSISVHAMPHAGSSAETYILSNGTTSQNVSLTAGFSAGATTVSVASFTASATYTASSATLSRDCRVTGVTVNQNLDGQSITFNSSITINPSDVITIACDPTSANGYTGSINGGSALQFSGIFPTMRYGVNNWSIILNGNNQPIATTSWQWYPRYAL